MIFPDALPPGVLGENYKALFDQGSEQHLEIANQLSQNDYERAQKAIGPLIVFSVEKLMEMFARKDPMIGMAMPHLLMLCWANGYQTRKNEESKWTSSN